MIWYATDILWPGVIGSRFTTRPSLSRVRRISLVRGYVLTFCRYKYPMRMAPRPVRHTQARPRKTKTVPVTLSCLRREAWYILVIRYPNIAECSRFGLVTTDNRQRYGARRGASVPAYMASSLMTWQDQIFLTCTIKCQPSINSCRYLSTQSE